MVLSYMEPPYDSLYTAQRETWDSVPEEDVHTLYYHGGEIGQLDIVRQHHKSHSILATFPETNAYYLMAAKFRAALNFALMQGFDMVFRTNSSSYVNKKLLKQIAAALPKEKLYAGWEIQGNAGYNVCSGAGFWLTPDTAKILAEKIDPEFEREEDVYVSQLLHEAGIQIIDDKSRFDVPINVDPHTTPLDRYHYRLKAGGSRENDAENMRKIHALISK